MFVKICGLRTPADVECAVGAGADAVGFVLAPSPRRVEVDDVVRLLPAVPDRVLGVGVFLDADVPTIRAAVAATGLRAVQLHGDRYTAADIADLVDLGVLVIRARAVGAGERLTVGAEGEDMLLLDSPTAGSGHRWDPTSVTVRGRWLLAGGLAPDTVAEAIAAARPWGVDVSSGVESARGVKDPARIRAFLTAARATS